MKKILSLIFALSLILSSVFALSSFAADDEISKDGWTIKATSQIQAIERAIDGDIDTIWHSGYTAEGGQNLFVLPLINQSFSLFIYTNGETVIEGIFNISEDRKTLYLYIENDIYEKVRKADKDNYDTTVSIYYPPDFYLRGSFDNNDNSIVINGLYHHPYSPTEIQDSVWVFDTYTRQ